MSASTRLRLWDSTDAALVAGAIILLVCGGLLGASWLFAVSAFMFFLSRFTTRKVMVLEARLGAGIDEPRSPRTVAR